jgi:hypothetical protein
MRVFLISQYDAAGQNYLLANAMRDHLDWDAKSMILQQTYLNYPTDWTLENKEEAREFAEGADVLIFQDLLFDVPGMKLQKIMRQNNTIIYGLGSLMRSHIPDVINYIRSGYHVLPPLSDPTITQYIGGAPFEAIIVDPRIDYLVSNVKRNDRITISHAPTKDMKGEETFEKIVKELDVDWLVVKGKSWEEAIKERAKAHIMLDSLGDVSYGLACLEGLALGQIVISNLSPWCYALHPDLPMTSLWGASNEEIRYQLKHAIELWGNYEDGTLEIIRKRGWAKDLFGGWVKDHFAPAKQARKWEQYINFVIS